METNELLETICKILDSKQAKNIKIVNLEGISVIADYFVICTGRSTTNVKALMENLENEMSKKYGVNVLRLEGKQEGKWCVLDYGDIIVHIFYEETRQTYSIDELWDNGQNVVDYKGKE